MSYELDQGGATRLIVEQDKTMDGVTPLVLVQAEHLMGDRVTVMVKPSQAPALALAILEAAGISRDWDERVVTIQNPTTPAEHFAKALNHLDYGIKAQTKQAEREAEDAKVREYRGFKLTKDPAYGETPWGDLTDNERDAWRTDYKSAREFFAREG